MLFIYIISLIVIIASEYLIFKMKLKTEGLILGVKKLNNFISSLKVLSFLPISKNNHLLTDLQELSNLILKENIFDAFTLIVFDDLPKNQKVYRFPKGIEDNKLTELEDYLCLHLKNFSSDNYSEIFYLGSLQDHLKRGSFAFQEHELGYQTAALKSLNFESKKSLGYLVLFSQQNLLEESDQRQYLSIVTNIITLTLNKFRLKNVLSVPDQLRAVSVQW
ncbi:hypothetical protein HYS93_00025 [Candidatus Daviesbacteria bacterium]|nr:hypothetical protein [Candidatus Daviesbacteria bacterium]